MKRGEQYLPSLRNPRPNIRKWGKPLGDVTAHPATRLHVAAIAASYDAAFDPESAPLSTA